MRTNPGSIESQLAFLSVMETFEDVDASEEIIASCIRLVDIQLEEPEAEEAKAPFNYWRAAFEATREATTRDQIKNLAREYLCSTGPYTMSPFNIAQGLMKATIHLMWRKLYALEVGRWRTDPEEAIRDATTPRTKRSQEFMHAIYEEIAAETGETVEGMRTRICGDDAK
jgi:hypothetical protein